MKPHPIACNMLRRFSLLLFVLLFNACTPIQRPAVDDAVASLPLSAPLPPDPDIRIGKLDNGLTYYIRHNEQPAKRAELLLAVNAGSILEDNDQRGLAHFLEHMLFNGTRRFAHNELDDFLESIGLEGGADSNAYTSFDETVYMLHVPTDDPATFAKIFDVLEDWAAYATLDPDEVEKERGIIVEEWRLSDANAQGRIFKQLWPVLLGDSQYTVREPIGDMEIVRNAAPEVLRRFYQDWYRPDLMAVIAVGDFDVDTVEQLIKTRFSSLSIPEQPRERISFRVPDHAEPRYLVISDPEQPYTAIWITIKRAAAPFEKVADFRNRLVNALFYQLFNQRLAELARQENAPFVSASAYESDFVRSVDATYYDAQVQDDGIAAGLTALVTEIERVRLHGFTATELERAKKIVLRDFEQTYKERNDTDNAAFAFSLLDSFLTGAASPSAETSYTLAQTFIPAITLDEVNAQVGDLVANENRVVNIVAPVKEGLTLPTEDELAAIYADVQASVIEPYVDQVVDEPLVAEPPAPVAIASTQQYAALDITEIELANGVRVLMKPTDFQEDEVIFSASSPGGLSLLADEEYWEGWLIPDVVAQSGVGDFTQTELNNLLAGQDAYVYPYIGDLYEGFSGSASPGDLETLFQLIYLYATMPRADTEGFAAVENQWTANLENRLLDPANVLYDAVNTALYGNDLRYRLPTAEEIQSVDQERALAIYHERFADLDDLTFVFAGNFEVETLTELAQRYLGALPGSADDETWRDHSPALPAGIVEEIVYQAQEEQSIVHVVFTGPADASEDNQFRLAALQRLIDLHVNKQLREELGGIYGAYVSSHMSVEPEGEYSFSIDFTCDPERVDELVTALFALIDEVQTNVPAAGDVDKVNEQIQRNQEESLEQNQWWVDQIAYFATTPGRDLTILAEQVGADEPIDGITFQAAAQEYLPQARYVKVVLYPETYEE